MFSTQSDATESTNQRMMVVIAYRPYLESSIFRSSLRRSTVLPAMSTMKEMASRLASVRTTEAVVFTASRPDSSEESYVWNAAQPVMSSMMKKKRYTMLEMRSAENWNADAARSAFSSMPNAFAIR